MINVNCHTNLDLRSERWPTELPGVPRVGDRVRSKTKHGLFQLELKVVRVIWEHPASVDIELHDARTRSIKDFYKWYCECTGDSVSSYI